MPVTTVISKSGINAGIIGRFHSACQTMGEYSGFSQELQLESVGCWIMHPIELKDFCIGFQLESNRFGFFSYDRYFVRVLSDHDELLSIIERLLEADYKRTLLMELPDRIVNNRVTKAARRLEDYASIIRKNDAFADTADAFIELSKRVYRKPCIAPTHLLGCYSNAVGEEKTLSEETDVGETLH